MDSLEELQKILNDAPADGKATSIDDTGSYIRDDKDGFVYTFIRNPGFWHKHSQPLNVTRSLADIQRIVDLMTLNQNMHTTVTGYLSGEEWAHWNEFNAGKFKL